VIIVLLLRDYYYCMSSVCIMCVLCS